MGATSFGMSAGLCCPSESMVTMMSAPRSTSAAKPVLRAPPLSCVCLVNNYFGSGFPGDFGCPVYAAIVNNDDVVSIESGKEDYASDRNFFIICLKYDGYILWGCTPFCKDVL